MCNYFGGLYGFNLTVTSCYTMVHSIHSIHSIYIYTFSAICSFTIIENFKDTIFFYHIYIICFTIEKNLYEHKILDLKFVQVLCKDHTTSLDKKSRNLQGQNKITQPFKFLVKIMQPLWTKKNHTTSQDKKSRKLLGQKKSRNLLGQKKSRNLLGLKKIPNLLVQKRYKTF